MFKPIPVIAMVLSAVITLSCATSWAQQTGARPSSDATGGSVAHQTDDETQAKNFENFAKAMSAAKLVGHFTMTGKPDSELASEEYHILEVKKMDEGDYWLFRVRIKYGGRDVTVPMPLEVKWAANTPVITLDNVEIPLLGTFSSRVVIDGNKYAGTWSHGDVGGHLFGQIVPGKAEPSKDAPESPAGDDK